MKVVFYGLLAFIIVYGVYTLSHRHVHPPVPLPPVVVPPDPASPVVVPSPIAEPPPVVVSPPKPLPHPAPPPHRHRPYHHQVTQSDRKEDHVANWLNHRELLHYEQRPH